MDYTLEDLVDIPQLKILLGKLNEIYLFPFSIFNLQGKLLIAIGEQDICFQFHRQNPQTSQKCERSDRYVLEHINEPSPPQAYTCPMGLVDRLSPIVIDGRRLGYLSYGQFFLEKPDLDRFKEQARLYGFDEPAYLQALEKVPVLTQEQLDKYLVVANGLINIIAGTGIARLKEIEARKAISASEEKFRSLFETIDLGVVYHDLNGAITAANPAAERALALTLDQMQGHTSFDPHWRSIHEDGSDFPGDTHPSSIALKTGKEVRNVVMGVFNPSSGIYRWININATPQFRCGEDRPYQVYATFEDITERKQADDSRRESEERNRCIYELSPIGIGITTLEGQVVSANRAMETLFGFAPGEMANSNVLDTYANPGDRHRLIETLARVGMVKDYGIRLKRRDGQVFDGRLWVSIISIGRKQLIQTICQDVTEYNLLTKKLVQAEKLAGLGNLAAGIAHEINSPLQILTGSSEVLLSKLMKEDLDREGLVQRVERIHDNSWRIARIIRSLLDYARSSQEELETTQLNDLVNDTLLLVEHQITVWSHIKVIKELGEGLPEFTCDRNQIIQSLISLLTNARDAIPEGGAVTIRTSYDAQKERLVLSVSDTGIGIPESVQSRIFDPFFTTKPLGQGTGLGLSIVHGTVLAHGGEIKVDSQPGRGSTFTISLPLIPPEGAARPLPTEARYDQ